VHPALAKNRASARHFNNDERNHQMQYMALIYSDPAREPAYGTPGFQKMMGDYFAFSEKAKAAGVFVSGEGLQGVHTATSVRVKNGKSETMDGPHAVTKELLGGYYVLDCPDLDQAIAWAAQIPSAAWGTVELRPVMIYN
jgi:hypothetical protein